MEVGSKKMSSLVEATLVPYEKLSEETKQLVVKGRKDFINFVYSNNLMNLGNSNLDNFSKFSKMANDYVDKGRNEAFIVGALGGNGSSLYLGARPFHFLLIGSENKMLSELYSKDEDSFSIKNSENKFNIGRYEMTFGEDPHEKNFVRIVFVPNYNKRDFEKKLSEDILPIHKKIGEKLEIVREQSKPKYRNSPNLILRASLSDNKIIYDEKGLIEDAVKDEREHGDNSYLFEAIESLTRRDVRFKGQSISEKDFSWANKEMDLEGILEEAKEWNIKKITSPGMEIKLSFKRYSGADEFTGGVITTMEGYKTFCKIEDYLKSHK